MSDDKPTCSGSGSGLHTREKRSIRFVVAPTGSSTFKAVEFYGLDKARLHAWSLALDGESVQIAKLLYDLTAIPAKVATSAVIERWGERSAFILLNSNLSGR